MNPDNDKRFQDLLQKYLSNTLQEKDFVLLEEMLAAFPAYLDCFLDEISLHTSLRRHFRSLEAVANVDEINLNFAPREREPGAGRYAKKHTGYSRPVISILVAATLLITCFSIGFSVFLSEKSVERAVVAHLAFEDEAQWKSSRFRQNKEAFYPGAYELTYGLARLDLVNGVIVTFEGPARFELISQNRIFLRSGRVTAKVPPQAIGFTVDSPEMRIVDYGTVFGVNVDGAGTTETLVFRGRVNVRKNVYGGASSAEHAVLEGEAIRADALDLELENVAFNGAPYAEAWPVMFGILDTEGDFQFVPPDMPHDITSYEKDEHVIVFPEREHIVLADDLTVNITQPGRHEHDWFDRAVIDAGTHVRSYLIAWQPDSVEKDTDKEIHYLRGQVVFDHPIAGLITEGELLGRTSKLLGDGFSNYEGFALRHSLEKPITPYQTIAPGADIVVISEDRRTLTLNLQAMRGGGDFVRVIVDVTGIYDVLEVQEIL